MQQHGETRVAYECEDHYSWIITEDYSLAKTLILMCSQILCHFFVPFICFLVCFSFPRFFCGATVFPAQKAEYPASEKVTLLERQDTNQRQEESNFQRLRLNPFFKVKSSVLLCQKYYSFRFGISTIPNPFSVASNWVKIIIKIHFREFGEWRI